MSYPSYLVHFNQNHSAKNGQFISGDGDGDGISNDHKNQKKTTTKKKYNNRYGVVAKTLSNPKKDFAIAAGIVGTVATVYAAKFIADYMKEKELESKYESSRRAAEFIKDQRRASVAKFAGGDW